MNIYLYIGMNLEKILLRHSHKPIYVFDISDYKEEISSLRNKANRYPMLHRLTINFTDKVEYRNNELSSLAVELEEFTHINHIDIQESKLFKWMVTSIECAVNHKKDIIITGQQKK